MAWFLNSRSGSYVEWCLNGTDDDRDGSTDNACDVHYQSRGTDGAGNPTTTGWFDRDGDGYFTVATETLPVWFDACLAATTFTASIPDAGVTGDCDNLDMTIHPGAQDLCDGVNQDCDGADGVPEICGNLVNERLVDDDCDGVVDDGCPVDQDEAGAGLNPAPALPNPRVTRGSWRQTCHVAWFFAC